MKKILSLTVIIALVITNAFAEDPIPPDGKIKGTVVDKSSGEPIEYATIAVYSCRDSALITGTITNPGGGFQTSKLPEGNYYVVVKFLGYQDAEVRQINLSERQRGADMGMLEMSPSTQDLEEVVVTTQHRPVEYKLDKKVIKVGEQMTAASLSAVEVLENVPSIRVDIEGNVSLRGSTGFTVLIDGKPTVLDASDALRQTPASTIENIEIITNPSSRYQADGTGGIINIITKKNRVVGLQGLVNAKLGSTGMYSFDGLLNYRHKKVNFFVGGDYNHSPFPGYQTSERQTTSGDTTSIIYADGDALFQRMGGGVRAGLDWDLTPKDNFSVSGRIGRFGMVHGSELDYSTWTTPGTDTVFEFSENTNERSMLFYNATAAYTHKFDQKDHDLMLQYNVRGRNGDELSENYLRDAADQISYASQSTEVGPGRMMETKLDYRKPLGENHGMEAGLQWRNGKSGDLTTFSLYNPATGEFELQPDQSHEVDYNRDIWAAYGIFNGENGGFGYQAGLRYEYTHREIGEVESPDQYIYEDGELFPTLHLSYQLNDKNQFMASYSKRVDRPRGYYLEPFITWTDMYNVRSGNPELEAEYIHSTEAGYIHTGEKAQLSLEAYYRIKNNKIERVQEVYQEGVLLSTMDNVGTDYSLGLETMYNIELFKWWNLNLMGDMYDYRIKSENLGVPYTYHSFNWGFRTNNTFTIAKRFRLQFDGSYKSPTITTQGEQSGYYMFNAAARTDFLDKRLSLTLQVRDVFGTMKHESINQDTYFYNYQSRQTVSPIFTLTASYRINNYRSANKDRGESGGGMEDDF